MDTCPPVGCICRTSALRGDASSFKDGSGRTAWGPSSYPSRKCDGPPDVGCVTRMPVARAGVCLHNSQQSQWGAGEGSQWGAGEG
jgi:hypothetical protein